MCRLHSGCVLAAGVVVLAFFFFKQKTAYDMRISDWSSDVCSSDLSAVADVDVNFSHACRPCLRSMPTTPLRQVSLRRPGRPGRPKTACSSPIGHLEIGRASCRERVCQYV